jgi:hypothetical protein
VKTPDPKAEAEKYKQLSEEDLQYLAERYKVSVKDVCCICGMKIRTMSFKGTGVCGELHRKVRDNDTEPWQGGARNP